MCGVSMKYRRTSKELRELVGVEPITTVIKSGRLRSYEHVMMKSDEDWVKKSMEYRVESRRPVVWKLMCQNFRSTEKMPMTGRNREIMF